MKYSELLQAGLKQLQDGNIVDAEIDSRLLLEYVCGIDRGFLLAHGNESPAAEKENEYFELLKKRACHVPLQHITGEQDFMGLRFQVNDKVLVPRQDTECLVEEVMRYLHDGMDILDLCTGSGCILLSLLHYSNDCRGTGVDISAEALKVAKENCHELNLKAEFITGNLLDEVNGQYDIIVSNPPYIESDVIETLETEVKDHEPMLALDGHEDGLFFYRAICSQVMDYLQGGGMLFFEIGYNQAKAVSELMEKAGLTDIVVVKDLCGLDRVVYGRK